MKCTKTETVKQFSAFCARGSKPSAGDGRAQREAGVRGRQPSTTEPSPRRRSRAQRQAGVLRSVQRKHCQCSNDSKRFTRCARLHLLSAQRIYSAHRYTVRIAAQRAVLHSAPRYRAPSASLRPALHCAKRCTVRSIVPPPPPALHSAQHYTAPSTTLHRAQRAKTRPIAASEPSIYKWWNISVSVQRLLRSNGTHPCKSCKPAHARAFVFPR